MGASDGQESVTERPHFCTKGSCQKTFKTLRGLKYHLTRSCETRIWHCTDCESEELFVHAKDLATHAISQHGTSCPFICTHENCGKRFPFPSTLQRHFNSLHNRSTQRLCGECNQWIRMRHFRKHNKNDHNKDIPLFSCSFKNCNRMFKRSQLLAQHVKTHDEKRKHVCTYNGCGQRHESKRGLEIHAAKAHGKHWHHKTTPEKEGPGSFNNCNAPTPSEQSLVKTPANTQVASRQYCEASKNMSLSTFDFPMNCLISPQPTEAQAKPECSQKPLLPSISELTEGLEEPVFSESEFYSHGIFIGFRYHSS